MVLLQQEPDLMNDHLSPAGELGATPEDTGLAESHDRHLLDPRMTRASLLLRVRDPEDQRAWAEFVARYGPYILTWSQRYYRAEAEDVTQEVLSKLVPAMTKFDYKPGPGKFRAWLKQVIHNLACTMKRRKREHATGGADYCLLDDKEATTDLMTTLAGEFDLELKEMAEERVRQRVESATWEAYVQTTRHGRKAAEVARELGLKVGALYQAKSSVIDKIREEITKLESSLD
jgi:RNA polymerase sigma factor (sigma-70 family)